MPLTGTVIRHIAGVILFVFGWMLFESSSARLSCAEMSEIPDAASKRIVTDVTDVLTSAEEVQVAAECVSFTNHNDADIVVYIGDKLFAMDDKTFVERLAASWKLGAGRSGRWIVLAVFKGGQQMKIGCSEGLNARLTRYTSFCIINVKIAPKYQQSKRAEGIRNGILAIDAALAGKLEIPLKYKIVSIFGSGKARITNIFIILWFAFIVALGIVNTRKRRAGRRKYG